jgi:lycopene beta-cyclase
MARRDFELVLVGGGLQNGLIALAALHADRSRRVAVVESGASLGGNHTWCVHPGDVPAAARPWIEPLVVSRWPSYEVRFPGLRRTLEAPYAAITSARFAEVVGHALQDGAGSALYLGRRAERIDAHEVRLDDGVELGAELVVDARGPDPAAFAGTSGYQKFLGLELAFAGPHAVERPILMDATVPQHDGFHFFYTLPLAADRLLVEETFFSREPALDLDASRAAGLAYAAKLGAAPHIVREESGVLPMPWAGSPAAAPGRSPLVAGYRGGWFHPATGYSFPPAVRLARCVAERPAAQAFDGRLAALWRAHRTQVTFAQRLNGLLFRCFEPEDAWNVFARFYTLPDAVIHRFYALATTGLDRARLVVGRPPRGFSFAKAVALGRPS